MDEPQFRVMNRYQAATHAGLAGMPECKGIRSTTDFPREINGLCPEQIAHHHSALPIRRQAMAAAGIAEPPQPAAMPPQAPRKPTWAELQHTFLSGAWPAKAGKRGASFAGLGDVRLKQQLIRSLSPRG